MPVVLVEVKAADLHMNNSVPVGVRLSMKVMNHDESTSITYKSYLAQKKMIASTQSSYSFVEYIISQLAKKNKKVTLYE